MTDVLLHHMTREEFRRAIEAGVYENYERLELLDGLVTEKMTVLPPHTASILKLSRWLSTILPPGSLLLTQMPVGIGLRSEPEPDLAVVDGVPEDFELEHPSASQTRLVVEVSDSSLRQDLGVKLRIYAGGGIPEYWVVDLKGRRIIIHTEPEGSSYGTTRYLRDDDVVAPPWGPEATIAVSELLPRIAVGEQR